MKLIFYSLITIGSFLACTSKAQDTTGGGDASTNGAWLYTLNEAQAQSVKRQKSILVYFTNSDTCARCAQLNSNIFATPLFKTWAEKNVVLLEVDFSVKNQFFEKNKEQYTGMAQSLKVNSYPTVWILNITHEPENNRFKVKPVGTVGYQETPEKFIGLLQNLIRK